MFFCLSLMTLLSFAGVRPDAQLRSKAGVVLKVKSSEKLQHVASCQGLEVYGCSEGGFAIMSSNDHLPALLAYSPDGLFSPGSVNPGLNWWLKAVAGRLSTMNQPQMTDIKPDTSRFAPRVEPLLTTVWGQREPFKFMCPFDHYVADRSLDGTYQPDSGHYSLGCGPAAMAQYMCFYKYPKRGTGTASVVVKYNEGNVTQTVDFAAATYDWNNMLDDYQGDYTTAQGMAVAQLCYHCGVAAETLWNEYGGGTTDAKILKAFIEHFGYNDTAHYVPRSRYDDLTWMNMVYSELSAGHPIFYSAKDINLEEGILAGHNFILDGYDENGLVHVNWGWYGIENGYFDLAILAVMQYTYDDWQAMYIGLYPKEGDYLAGDVDEDGKLTIADVTTLISLLLSNHASMNAACDVDGDGVINIADVTELINMLLTGSR